MEKDINKIIKETLASLALENLSVSDEKIQEVKEKHKNINKRKVRINDRRR